MGPEKWVGVISGGTEKGLQTVFNNYDLYGKDGIKYFGKDFYWKSFAAGFAGGDLKELSGNLITNFENDLNVDNPINPQYDFSLFSVGLTSISGDVTKKLSLKSMNKEYKIYLKKNKQDQSLSFFNGASQLLMYHFGK